MNPKIKKLKNNTLLMILGNFSSKVLVFLLLPLYTHILSTEEYGIADIVFTTINLLYPFFSLLMTEAILRFALDEKTKENRALVFSTCIYISTLGFILLLAISPFFTFITIFKDYYIYFMVFYVTHVIYLLFSQYAKGINLVKEYAIAGVLNTFITIICNIVFLLVFKWGIKGYLWAYIIGSTLASTYLLIKAKYWQYIISIKKLKKSYTKKIIQYALPMIPNSLSWWISNSSDKYMVTFFKGIAENGIYSVSYKIPTLLTTFSSIFISAWQLSAVEDFGSEENRKIFESVYHKYSALNIIIVSVLIGLVKIIASILFAKNYYTAWMPACILLLAYVFNTLAAFLGTVYTSAKKTNNLFVSTFIAAIINICLNALLIPIYGMVGAAFATLVSYFFVWIYRLYNSKKILFLNINIKKDIFCYILITIEIASLFLLNNIALYGTIIIVIGTLFIMNRELIKDIIQIVTTKWNKLIRRKKVSS